MLNLPQCGASGSDKGRLRAWPMRRCRWMVADCSACTVMMSLPALAKSATRAPGSTIILRSGRGQRGISAQPHRGARGGASQRDWHDPSLLCTRNTPKSGPSRGRSQPAHEQAAAQGAMGGRGRGAHRCVSRTASVRGRMASTISGPIVMSVPQQGPVSAKLFKSARGLEQKEQGIKSLQPADKQHASMAPAGGPGMGRTGHKAAIHNVDMNPVCAGLDYGLHLRPRVGTPGPQTGARARRKALQESAEISASTRCQVAVKTGAVTVASR